MRLYYSYPKLSARDLGFIRFDGGGIGNLLFPWARFIVGTNKYCLTPIAPTWPQIRIGPILRNESDKRFYFDLFRRSENHIHGLRKCFLLKTVSRVTELDFQTAFGSNLSEYKKPKPKIVVFEGLRDWFKDILKDRKSVRDELLGITKDIHKIGLQQPFGDAIFIHVRLGDFKIGNRQTPIEWFVETTKIVRKAMGLNKPIYIFSDGTNEDLKLLLGLPQARRLSFGSSIADLLALSSANLLIASGGSSFNMWASYLGGMLTIWPENCRKLRIYADAFEEDTDSYIGQRLPDRFVARIKE